MLARVFCLAVAYAIVGCSGKHSDDLGAGPDSGAKVDAGQASDSSADAGAASDGASALDAATDAQAELDATSSFDAGSMDAGSMDAGAMDAGSTDAGSMDAGDAAQQDAALPIDAGPGCIAPTDAPLSVAQAGLPESGLVLWLRADRGVYKTSSDDVCAWADGSGGGRVFRASSARPKWNASGAASLPAIEFLAGRGLSVGDVLGLPAQSARTFVAVQTLSNTTARFSAIIQGQSGTPGTYVSIDTNTFQTAGSREGVYVTNNAYDSDLATSTASRLHVFAIDPMTIGSAVLPALTYRVNGTVQTLKRTPGGLGNGNFENFSGANFTTVGNGQGGSDVFVSEILAYDHVLSPSELATLEGALRARYGLP